MPSFIPTLSLQTNDSGARPSRSPVGDGLFGGTNNGFKEALNANILQNSLTVKAHREADVEATKSAERNQMSAPERTTYRQERQVRSDAEALRQTREDRHRASQQRAADTPPREQYKSGHGNEDKVSVQSRRDLSENGTDHRNKAEATAHAPQGNKQRSSSANSTEAYDVTGSHGAVAEGLEAGRRKDGVLTVESDALREDFIGEVAAVSGQAVSIDAQSGDQLVVESAEANPLLGPLVDATTVPSSLLTGAGFKALAYGETGGMSGSAVTPLELATHLSRESGVSNPNSVLGIQGLGIQGHLGEGHDLGAFDKVMDAKTALSALTPLKADHNVATHGNVVNIALSQSAGVGLQNATAVNNLEKALLVGGDSALSKGERFSLAMAKTGELGLLASAGADEVATDVKSALGGSSVLANTGALSSSRLQMPVNITFGQRGWAEMVAERSAMMAAQSIKFAELQLDPPELGQLQVKVTVNQDQATVSFAAPNAQVKEALDQTLVKLRELLDEQGLDLVDVDVSDQSSSQADEDESLAKQDTDAKDAAREEAELDSGQKTHTVNAHYGIDHYA